MKTLLLTPVDTLFFRDGRPMEGSLTGHTAAWCPPQLISYALLGALHRSGLGSRSLSGEEPFDTLQSAGPFPVDPEGRWYFPAPGDLGKTADGREAVKGVRPMAKSGDSSLPVLLTHFLGATLPPAKDSSPGQWLRADAWEQYLNSADGIPTADFKTDADIGAIENSIGIGLDRKTGVQNGQQFYSAQYLRLKDGWKMGIEAIAENGKTGELIEQLFPAERHIAIGGQQRICSVEPGASAIPFPKSAADFPDGLVKWILLSPALFPEIAAEPDKPGIKPHPGGWLPSWIDRESGQVLLKQNIVRGCGESRLRWRERVRDSAAVDAKLIAAKIGKPLPVSGWRLKTGRGPSGAKPTQLAVPAGSIYYFQCGSPDAAKQLAAMLSYPCRRSAIWGEKGYGLGVCSAFQII